MSTSPISALAHGDQAYAEADAARAAPAESAVTEDQAGGTAATQPAGAVDFEVYAAMDLFKQDKAEAAAEAFRRVLARDPDQPVALYWLGLTEMRRGLEQLANARSTTNADEHARLEADARAAFSQADKHLSRLLSLMDTDPNVRQIRPVEAGLTLGIAELVRAADKTEAIQFARKAITTLEAYNRDTAATPDYLGYFFLAIAHFRLGVYTESVTDKREAAQHFKRALELVGGPAQATQPAREAGQPSDYQTISLYKRYYEGIMLATDGQFERGAALLKEVAGEAGDIRQLALLRDNAASLAKVAADASVRPRQIQLLEDQRPFGPLLVRGDLRIGNGYDSNVILLGDGTALPRRIPRQGDYFGDLSAGVEVSRRLTKAQDKFAFGEALTLGVGGDTTHQWHPNIREYDIDQYRGRAFVLWEFAKDWFNYWEYSYSDTELGHAPFIDAHSATIGLTRRFSDPETDSYGTQISVYYGYDYRNYHDAVGTPRLDRDGNYHLIGAKQAFDLLRADKLWHAYYADDARARPERDFDAKRWMNAYFGYEFRDERTQGSEFDNHGHSLLAGVQVPLPLRLSFDYNLRMAWDDYNSWSLFDYTREPRQDFRQFHGFGLTYTVVARGERADLRSLEVLLRGFAEMVWQDSNIRDSALEDVYSYGRGQYGLALQIRF